MTIDTKKRDRLLEDIINIELEMFEKAKSVDPSLGQENAEAFKTMRDMAHSILSTETLMFYLADLQNAKKDGRNLQTEKYTRIKNPVPPIKTSADIEEIIKIEGRWMRELSGKYPRTFKAGTNKFHTNQSFELETYSDKTLKSYLEDVLKAESQNFNLAEMRFLRLFRTLGYESISQIEESAKT